MSQPVSNQSAQPNVPWNDQQLGEVKGLRRAISTRQDAQRVDSDVAPLMSELLARVDTQDHGARPSHIARPQMTNAQGRPIAEPSLQRQMQATHSARAKLADSIQHAPDEASRQRLVGMLRVLEEHVKMKQEVLFRVQDSTSG